MWERLDNTQLEIDGEICNILKEEEFKYKKKNEDTCQQTPIPHVIRREKTNFFIYKRGFVSLLRCPPRITGQKFVYYGADTCPFINTLCFIIFHNLSTYGLRNIVVLGLLSSYWTLIGLTLLMSTIFLFSSYW